jgi:hypothetical protein
MAKGLACPDYTSLSRSRDMIGAVEKTMSKLDPFNDLPFLYMSEKCELDFYCTCSSITRLSASFKNHLCTTEPSKSGPSAYVPIQSDMFVVFTTAMVVQTYKHIRLHQSMQRSGRCLFFDKNVQQSDRNIAAGYQRICVLAW